MAAILASIGFILDCLRVYPDLNGKKNLKGLEDHGNYVDSDPSLYWKDFVNVRVRRG